jgi:hypothetical protein
MGLMSASGVGFAAEELSNQLAQPASKKERTAVTSNWRRIN